MKQQIRFILLGIFFCSNVGFSQELSPEFEFQLYFEDAAGNKDTVTIGYDSEATGEIDEGFGEKNILEEPWGDELDVRIGDLVYHEEQWGTTKDDSPLFSFDADADENSYLTKKKVVEHFCEYQYESASRRVSVQFVSNHFPIVVKWDRSPFENMACIGYSMLYGKTDHMHVDAGGNFLLSSRDSIQITENKILEEENIPNYYNADSLDQKIYVLQFNFVNASTASVENNVLDNPKVFPNPVYRDDFLNIDGSGEYQIINGLGEIIDKGEVNNKLIPINVKDKGLYILKVKTISKSEELIYKIIVL